MEAHLRKIRRRNRIVFAGCTVFVTVVYAATMIRMKQTAPGNLEEMEPLPPEEDEEESQNKGVVDKNAQG
ncbi:hypothetical protein Gasu2_37060 [Galdieria sulphuraria]|uniref:Uncharacterized protein n=1 Tax=Galdieria sulphuraria TaxID=130081 RepID=M2X902_GALSU|nr:uncharacterized protein Gasu_60730 [Galdieria sulphuraria]EME26297.1 hypothetical protein Gasu_60730 [Galdieria sulphuraria]GJD09452.1 hypothetical protein Gasu2_37060 [Galdieria sulphuraria]|eukprot:XP_005702817.1 hypothetical protein Gasu_60730 [Galdieria sulphuraria]